MVQLTSDALRHRIDRSFITEVPRFIPAANVEPASRTLQGVQDKDEHGIRGPEKIDATVAAVDVTRPHDKFGEKKQRGKSVRSLIQKAAQKTMVVVRTKNATQAAESVTIRFNKNNITDVPRLVVLRDVCQRVLASINFSSNRKRYLFFDLFDHAPEVDAVLKDMFWYFTAHCFQPDRHKHLEQNFYQRIADNFTSLFIRVQVQPTSRDAGFFDMLPDVLAQIQFMALYEGFPKSRKNMIDTDLRKDLLRVCFSWVLGFVPAELNSSHWMSVDQESPKRIAALADFPAMRNRMLRAERIERTKLEVKNRHGSVLDTTDDHGGIENQQDEDIPTDGSKLPLVRGGHHTHGTVGAHVETHERCVYQMRNSPLVDTFLKRHHLEANARHLKVQLRMTSGKQYDLSNQEALHATTLPRARRRRLVNPKSSADALDQIEGIGETVRASYEAEKKKARDQDAMERRTLLQEERELEAQFSELRNRSTKVHEFSNLIASKSRIDALYSAATVSKDAAKASPHAGPQNFVPRPPPPRSQLSATRGRTG